MTHLHKAFKKYIRHSEEKAIIENITILICNLTNLVKKVCQLKSFKVYTTTKVIKHLYDKKPAEEFDFILNKLSTIIKYPDHIYNNKECKRGTFCFTKKIKNINYLASLEVQYNENNEEIIIVVTCFRIRNIKYLKKYELLWSWKDGIPSS